MMSLSGFETTGAFDDGETHRMKSKRMQRSYKTKRQQRNLLSSGVIGAEILSSDGSADSEFGFNMKS